MARTTEPAGVVAAIRACRPNDPSAETRDAARRALEVLPPAWTRLFGRWGYHEKQAAARASVRDPSVLYVCIEAGRRSGKTLDRMADIVEAALDPSWPARRGVADRRIVVAAPTLSMALRLYSSNLVSMIPVPLLRSVRWDDTPTIETVVGARIELAGLDHPERVEGEPIDDLFLDSPALSGLGLGGFDAHFMPGLLTMDRPHGRVVAYGTPGGWFSALCDRWAGDDRFRYHRWTSEGFVDAEQLEQARRQLEPEVFATEYLAEWPQGALS